MIRRINSNYILKNEAVTNEHLMIEANMFGYPYYKHLNQYYIVRTNIKNTKLQCQLVTDEVVEV